MFNSLSSLFLKIYIVIYKEKTIYWTPLWKQTNDMLFRF